MDKIVFNPNYNKWFLTKVKQAVKDFQMITHNDLVAIGLSGGHGDVSFVSFRKKGETQ